MLAYIASPTSPPYVSKQLTALFHTQPLLKYLVYSIAAPMVNCIFLLKPSPALQASGHCHQLGLAYGCETWAFPTNTLLATGHCHQLGLAYGRETWAFPTNTLLATGHCHQLGLAYGRETWAFPTNTLLATVTFMLLLDTNLLPHVSRHYSLLTAT